MGTKENERVAGGEGSELGSRVATAIDGINRNRTHSIRPDHVSTHEESMETHTTRKYPHIHTSVQHSTFLSSRVTTWCRYRLYVLLALCKLSTTLQDTLSAKRLFPSATK